MIPPTIGRVVLVQNLPGSTDPTQAEPALVSYVWGDRMINVGGFDHNGAPFAFTSLRLLQDDDPSNDFLINIGFALLSNSVVLIVAHLCSFLQWCAERDRVSVCASQQCCSL